MSTLLSYGAGRRKIWNRQKEKEKEKKEKKEIGDW
jgi:hypothetical protein